jgi:hypothetical protein
MASTPVFNIRLTGEENVTILNENVTWTPIDKYEATLTMKVGDAPKTIDYSVVEKVRLMVFYGAGSFIVTETVGTEVIAHEVQDVFVLTPTVAYRNSITSITVSTTSTSDIEIQCRVYGED